MDIGPAVLTATPVATDVLREVDDASASLPEFAEFLAGTAALPGAPVLPKVTANPDLPERPVIQIPAPADQTVPASEGSLKALPDPEMGLLLSDEEFAILLAGSKPGQSAETADPPIRQTALHANNPEVRPVTLSTALPESLVSGVDGATNPNQMAAEIPPAEDAARGPIPAAVPELARFYSPFLASMATETARQPNKTVIPATTSSQSTVESKAITGTPGPDLALAHEVNVVPVRQGADIADTKTWWPGKSAEPVVLTDLTLAEPTGEIQQPPSGPSRDPVQSANSPAEPKARTAQHVASQIAAEISRTDTGKTEILLDPKELGRVRLTMHTTEQAISIVILAERPETSDLMRRHIDQLAQEFRAIGYEDIRFSFGDQTGQRDQRPPPTGTTGEFRIDAAETTPELLDPSTRVFGRTSSGQLDLRL